MATTPGTSLDLDSMSPDEMREALAKIARQQSTSEETGEPKIKDALLALRLRPKVMVTTYIPRGRTGGYRIDRRPQDIKVWERGIIDPHANEEFPDRPQLVLVEDLSKPVGSPERFPYRNDALLDEYPMPEQGTVARRRPDFDQTGPQAAPAMDVEQLKAMLLQLGWKPPDPASAVPAEPEPAQPRRGRQPAGAR
jgi:hypothetical protein